MPVFIVFQNGIRATGTARNRKGMPTEVVQANFKEKGESIVMHKGQMMAMKIKDRKQVSRFNIV